MDGSQDQRPRAAALAVTTVVACAALLWVGATAATDRIRLPPAVSSAAVSASLDEVATTPDLGCPDLAATAAPDGLVLCASVSTLGGEDRPLPSARDPLTEVLVAQGYCAVAPLPDDDESLDAEPTTGCLPSSVPLDLSGVSPQDRAMIENLLSVPDPEFTVAE